VRDLPSTIASLSERLSDFTADQSTASAHATDPITIRKQTLLREDAPVVLGEELDVLSRNVRNTTRVPLGIYRGLRFGLCLNPQSPPDVYLEGEITRRSTLSRDHQGPRAVLNALERLANTYDSECVRFRQDLSVSEAQLRDYQARLGKPFLHDAYLSELSTLRDQLKAGLSSAAHEPEKKARQNVAEIAERIKALKSAHNIEATQQRTQQKKSTAEEPVTARIRRRAEASSASLPAKEAECVSGAGEVLPQESGENSLSKPMTFQKRLMMQRHGKDEEPSLP
ncbi:MAG: hypothetical protein ACRD3Q_21560, partial [Terriglobales bacterium]